MHTYSSYAAPTPLQAGVAAALDAEEHAPGGGKGPDDMSRAMESNFQVLKAALEEAGLKVFAAEGGYFAVVDISSTGLDSTTYCKRLIEEAKVAAVPLDYFYASATPPPPSTLVRFALCKKRETLVAAAAAIKATPIRAK